MNRQHARRTRRAVLRSGLVCGTIGLAGCGAAPGATRPLSESFEDDMDSWTTHSHIGPEEPQEAFEWTVTRSQREAHDGDWSLEVFTEGDHDDGVAWASTSVEPPADADSFTATFQAWSLSESFNTLRNVVASLGPEAPEEEGDFPDPGVNTTAMPDAPAGGLREPLHLAEGWREYSLEWEPETVPDELVFAVGVAVVWEADATHYVDSIEVEAD